MLCLPVCLPATAVCYLAPRAITRARAYTRMHAHMSMISVIFQADTDGGGGGGGGVLWRWWRAVVVVACCGGGGVLLLRYMDVDGIYQVMNPNPPCSCI